MTKTKMSSKEKTYHLPKIENLSHGHFPLIRNPSTRSKMYQSIIPDNFRPIAPEITWINAPKLQFSDLFCRKKIRKKCIFSAFLGYKIDDPIYSFIFFDKNCISSLLDPFRSLRRSQVCRLFGIWNRVVHPMFESWKCWSHSLRNAPFFFLTSFSGQVPPG